MSAPQKPDLIARAHDAWDEAPDWVIALAEASMATSQSAVSRKVGYSSSVISQAISNSYPGNIQTVEERVRGALLNEKVSCPALGEMTRNDCLDWQGKPFAATSSLRIQMHRACRSGCRHSRLQREY